MGEPVVTTYTYDHAGRLVRTETVQWTESDREAAMALQAWENTLCPGCGQSLEETTKAEHFDAYRPDEPIRCHYCVAQAIAAGADTEQRKNAGLLRPIRLDLEVVEINKQPAPPLPPELGG